MHGSVVQTCTLLGAQGRASTSVCMVSDVWLQARLCSIGRGMPGAAPPGRLAEPLEGVSLGAVSANS